MVKSYEVNDLRIDRVKCLLSPADHVSCLMIVGAGEINEESNLACLSVAPAVADNAAAFKHLIVEWLLPAAVIILAEQVSEGVGKVNYPVTITASVFKFDGGAADALLLVGLGLDLNLLVLDLDLLVNFLLSLTLSQLRIGKIVGACAYEIPTKNVLISKWSLRISIT